MITRALNALRTLERNAAARLGRVLLVLALMASISGVAAPATAAQQSSRAAAVGSIVTFADSDLEAAVRIALSKPAGDITDMDMAGLTVLVAASSNISDLSGLEYATNLTTLGLDGNQVSELGPLAGLFALASVSIRSNKIHDLGPLVANGGFATDDVLIVDGNYLDLGSGVGDMADINELTARGVNVTYHPQESTGTYVPDLVGMNSADVDGALVADGLQLGSVIETYSATALSGEVISQYPLASDFVAGGTVVDIVVSIGRDAVLIPDEGLESAVRAELGIPTGDITHADMLALTQLSAGSLSITDLSGLEHATHLNALDLSHNGLTDLGPLAGLTELRTLDLSYNSVSSLVPLAGLTELRTVDLSSNDVSSLVSLSGLSGIEELYLGFNLITDVSPLAGLTSIQTLGLNDNEISDISSLSGLTTLTYLTLEDNLVSNISALSGMTAMTDLHLASNEITSLSALSGMTHLTSLGLGGNTVSSVAPIAGCVDLTVLNLEWNEVADISPLSGMSSLTELDLGHNNVDDLSPAAGMIALTKIRCAYNQISDISSLSGLTGLSEVALDYNDIEDVSSLAGLPELLWASIEGNRVHDIAPLVENVGFGAGDVLYVGRNYLDLAPGSRDVGDIADLSARGVIVDFNPQAWDGVTVPDLAGKSLGSAEASLTAVWLPVGSVTETNSATVPAGHVISHDPEAGELIAPYSPVDLVVSMGPVLVTVPDLAGKTQTSAEASLTAAGLVLGSVTETYSASIPVGRVVSQDPAAHATAPEGSAVDIAISKGPKRPCYKLTMPKPRSTKAPYAEQSPAKLVRNRAYRWSGYLGPKHSAGEKSVFISVKRWVPGKGFEAPRTYWATNYKYSTSTEYRAAFSLPAGRYKITPVAVEDATHCRTVGTPNWVNAW